jgi:hypothetical protein
VRNATDLAALIADIANRRPIPQGLDGVVVPGSYNPADGTCDVAIGDTLALPADGIAGPIILKQIQILTPAVGVQTGPLGMERTLLIPRQSGWAAIVEHGTDDSPNAQAGETVIQHRPTSSALALRNDAKTPGDGLGSYQLQGLAVHAHVTAGGHTIIQDDIAKVVKFISSGGHSIIQDDTNKVVTFQTAGGHSVVMDDLGGQVSVTTKASINITLNDGEKKALMKLADGTQTALDGINKLISHTLPTGEQTILDGVNHTITHLASSIGLGQYASILGAEGAIVAKQCLDEFQASLLTARLNDIIAAFQLLHTIGTMTGAQLTASLVALVAGFLPGIPTCGSAKVFAA